MTVLMGPSGCGKTTLLRIVAQLDDRFDGEVQMPASARIGFMFQEPRLLPWRTVRQNIELVAAPGFTEEELDRLARAVGIADMLPRYPQELSLGLARRVALARAFATSPTFCCWTSLSSRLTRRPPTACGASCSMFGRHGRRRRSSSPITRARRSSLPISLCCSPPGPPMCSPSKPSTSRKTSAIHKTDREAPCRSVGALSGEFLERLTKARPPRAA